MKKLSLIHSIISCLSAGTLISCLLSGCEMDSEPLSSTENTTTDETQPISSEENVEVSTEKINSDVDYSCDYYTVTKYGNWEIGYSDEHFVSFYSTIGYTGGTPTNYTAFDAEADDEHFSAEITAMDICIDYEESGDELLVKEIVDFRGYEAYHLLFLMGENHYFEYYFFEINDVLFTIFSNLSADNYEILHEESEKLIEQFELLIEGDSPVDTTKAVEKNAGFTMQDIIKANKLSNLLNRYESVMVEIEMDDMMQSVYADECITCLTYDDGSYEGFMDGRICTSVYGMKYETQFVLGDMNDAIYEECILSEQFSSNEIITEIYESDGLLTVVTEMNESDSAYMLLSYDFEYINGDTIVTEYTLKPDDYTIIESTVSLNSADGHTEELFSTTVTTDTERPAQAQDIFEHMTLPDTRTITLIMEPGTADEKVISTVGIQGDPIQFISYDNSGSDISKYEDRACTSGYTTDTDSDKSADITIYGKYR